MTLTPDMVEIERKAFEAELSTADNYDAKYLKRDSAYTDYYANRIMQAVWEGWCMKTRAQSQRAVAVAELEALVARWSNTDEHFGDDHGKAMTECADELRALIDGVGGGV